MSLNLAFAIFGGTAPMIATWLVAHADGLPTVAVYLSILAVLSAIACFFIPERRGVALAE